MPTKKGVSKNRNTMKSKEKAIVLASAYDKQTGKKLGKSRAELIDLQGNWLFRNCKNILEIKLAYENFWNHLNPNCQQVVMVSKVTYK